jgi:integrase
MASTPPDDPIARLYLEHMTQVQRTPANTIRARMRTLRSIGNPGTATREEVEAWWESRADLSPSTRSNDLANLRSFYKWADRWEHRPIATDPTRRLDAPTLPKGLPHPISRADLHTLLDSLDGDMRRAVCLGAYGGLRVAEAAKLDWSDIDMETSRMRIAGKGLKTRLVGISSLLRDSLLPDTGGNVVTAGGTPHSADSLQRKVNRAIAATGVRATFHDLRHRYATVGLASTGDLLGVSRALGHASVATTAIYAATSDEVLDRIADAVVR